MGYFYSVAIQSPHLILFAQTHLKKHYCRVPAFTAYLASKARVPGGPHILLLLQDRRTDNSGH
jgi:hypothetical protein